MQGPEPVRLCTEDDIVLAADYYDGVSAAVTGGPAYLLGHGFTGSTDRAEIRFVAGHLAARGASVLALNFRGHGRSEGRCTLGADEPADVAAALAWLRERQAGVPVVTLGFSMGASIMVRHAGLAALAGADRPEAVVAVSGPGRWYERGTKPMRRVHAGAETRLGRLVLQRVCKTRIGHGWDLLPASPVELVGALTSPVLVVHGDADPYFPLAHPRMLAGAAARATLWIEPGMGHAENATDAQLLDRIDGWGRAAVSATMIA